MLRINVDYQYYTEIFKGDVLDEARFNRFAKKGELLINKMTYGRIHEMELCTNDLEAVKAAICAMTEIQAENFKLREATGGRLAKGINTDGESVTYADTPTEQTEEETLYQKCYSEARLYLEDTALLHPGVFHDY